jgi:hypothetical protein
MKKLNGLDKYVIFSIVLLLLFTVAEFITSSVTNFSHDMLITCFYAAFGGEILSCALIKIFKLRGGTDDNTLADPRIDCPDLQCGGDDMADSHDYHVGD